MAARADDGVREAVSPAPADDAQRNAIGVGGRGVRVALRWADPRTGWRDVRCTSRSAGRGRGGGDGDSPSVPRAGVGKDPEGILPGARLPEGLSVRHRPRKGRHQYRSERVLRRAEGEGSRSGVQEPEASASRRRVSRRRLRPAALAREAEGIHAARRWGGGAKQIRPSLSASRSDDRDQRREVSTQAGM